MAALGESVDLLLDGRRLLTPGDGVAHRLPCGRESPRPVHGGEVRFDLRFGDRRLQTYYGIEDLAGLLHAVRRQGLCETRHRVPPVENVPDARAVPPLPACLLLAFGGASLVVIGDGRADEVRTTVEGVGQNETLADLAVPDFRVDLIERLERRLRLISPAVARAIDVECDSCRLEEDVGGPARQTVDLLLDRRFLLRKGDGIADRPGGVRQRLRPA